MSAAFRGDEDFEQKAMWLATTLLRQLTPRSAVRFLRRVIEIGQSDPEYQDRSDTCLEECGYANCDRVCARASDAHRHCRCLEHQRQDMRNRRYDP